MEALETSWLASRLTLKARYTPPPLTRLKQNLTELLPPAGCSSANSSSWLASASVVWSTVLGDGVGEWPRMVILAGSLYRAVERRATLSVLNRKFYTSSSCL